MQGGPDPVLPTIRKTALFQADFSVTDYYRTKAKPEAIRSAYAHYLQFRSH